MRLQRSKGVSQAVREIRARGVVPERDKTAKTQAPALHKALENEDRMLSAYGAIASTLHNSQTQADRELGQALEKSLQARGYALKINKPALQPQPGI